MKIMAFDPSKYTGWAVYDTSKHMSSIECGVFEMPDKADEYFTAEELGRRVNALIKQYGKPDIVVLEEMARAQIGPSNAAAIIYAAGSAFAIMATIGNWGIPSGTIMPSRWRKMFFGEGFKPPQKIVKGKKPTNDWKVAAVAECERMGVILPTKKTISHNAAEAVALAICWRGITIHAGRHHAAIMNLLQQRNERAAA